MAVVIAAILTPFILIIIMLCSLMSGMASHNNAAVDYTFNGGMLPITMPAEYKTYITEMRSCFSSLDSAIAAVESEMEDGDSLDSIRVKAVFYALYFGSDSLQLRSAAARDFVECFVTYEERTRTVTEIDDNGNEVEVEETYLVAVPIEDLPTIYANVGNHVGRAVTSDDAANITEIYLRVLYDNFDLGADMSLEGGNGTHDLIAELIKESDVVPSAGGFVSPRPEAGKTKSPPNLDTGKTRPVPVRKVIQAWIWEYLSEPQFKLLRMAGFCLCATSRPAMGFMLQSIMAEVWSPCMPIALKY